MSRRGKEEAKGVEEFYLHASLKTSELSQNLRGEFNKVGAFSISNNVNAFLKEYESPEIASLPLGSRYTAQGHLISIEDWIKRILTVFIKSLTIRNNYITVPEGNRLMLVAISNHLRWLSSKIQANVTQNSIEQHMAVVNSAAQSVTQEENKQLVKQLEQQKTLIEKLTQEAAEVPELRDQLEKTKRRLEKANEETERECEDLKKRVKHSDEIRDKTQNNWLRTEEELDKLKIKLNVLERTLTRTEAERNSLRNELNELTEITQQTFNGRTGSISGSVSSRLSLSGHPYLNTFNDLASVAQTTYTSKANEVKPGEITRQRNYCLYFLPPLVIWCCDLRFLAAKQSVINYEKSDTFRLPKELVVAIFGSEKGFNVFPTLEKVKQKSSYYYPVTYQKLLGALGVQNPQLPNAPEFYDQLAFLLGAEIINLRDLMFPAVFFQNLRGEVNKNLPEYQLRTDFILG